MPNDNPQPEPARDFAAEAAAKHFGGVYHTETEKSLYAAGVRAGLRHAAEIADGEIGGGHIAKLIRREAALEGTEAMTEPLRPVRRWG
jgi:hypothetical protein